MDNKIEQALSRVFPQTLAPGDLDHLEVLAMEQIKRYFIFRQALPPFLKSNQLIDQELIEVIKFSVMQKDWLLLQNAATWLTLTITERSKLKESLETDFPDPALWQP